MTDSELNEAKLEALLGIINSSARQAIAEYKKTGHGVPSADSTTFHPLDLATDTVSLKRAIRLLEGAYHQLSAILAPPQHTVFNFVENCNGVCTDIAVRARIADALDQHPEGLSVDKLADAVNLDKGKTARVLRALSIMGCFKEVERDVFANTRLSLILKSTNSAGCYVRTLSPLLLKSSAVLYETMTDPEFGRSNKTDKAPRAFGHRKDGIKDGMENFFREMINNNPEMKEMFYRGMIGHTWVTGSLALLHQYPWNDVSSVVDIGCGIGAVSIPLAKMFPSLRITNHDLPGVITMAQQTWEKDAPETLLDGHVEFVALNFFEDVPVVEKDVYYLRNVLHDWPDAEATTILRNTRKAMGPHSRVLIHESVFFPVIQLEEPMVDIIGSNIAPAPMSPDFGAGSHRVYNQDMTNWLAFNLKERTLDELKIIGATAGLTLTRVYDLVETMAMEFRITQN